MPTLAAATRMRLATRDHRARRRPPRRGSPACATSSASSTARASAAPAACAAQLNSVLPTLTTDFVVVLAADQVANRDFIGRTLAHFDDPAVALVQTPRDFYNEDSFEHVPAAASASPSRTCSSAFWGRAATASMPPSGTAAAPSFAGRRSTRRRQWLPARRRRGRHLDRAAPRRLALHPPQRGSGSGSGCHRRRRVRRRRARRAPPRCRSFAANVSSSAAGSPCPQRLSYLPASSAGSTGGHARLPRPSSPRPALRAHPRHRPCRPLRGAVRPALRRPAGGHPGTVARPGPRDPRPRSSRCYGCRPRSVRRRPCHRPRRPCGALPTATRRRVPALLWALVALNAAGPPWGLPPRRHVPFDLPPTPVIALARPRGRWRTSVLLARAVGGSAARLRRDRLRPTASRSRDTSSSMASACTCSTCRSPACGR